MWVGGNRCCLNAFWAKHITEMLKNNFWVNLPVTFGTIVTICLFRKCPVRDPAGTYAFTYPMQCRCVISDYSLEEKSPWSNA